MLRRLATPRAVRSLATRPSPEETPAQRSEREKAAAQLAMQSLKDMGSLLSSSAPEDETQPIDTAPIYADPKLFGALSLLHQGQVLKELQDKYDRKWTKMARADRQLGYYIAYGDWGSREDFRNWRSPTAPLDLPFAVPSQVATAHPAPSTPVHRLPPVVLADTEVRRPQFNVKRIDGATKFFLYVIVAVAMAAVYRDVHIGEEGQPREEFVADPYEERRVELERQREAAREEEAARDAARHATRKWYYLWLR
ncbi:Genetic interactor of prohibitin 7, mitochondrial [[Candida] zeylanoides]